MGKLSGFGIWMIGIALATTVNAQGLVGKALVDGREVELFSDKTWRFSEESAEDCRTLSAKLAFCGNASEWKPTAAPTSDILAAFRHDDKNYGQFIIEDLGMAQGLTMPAVREFVLGFAEQAAGEPPVIISTDPVTMGELTGETMVYAITISGVELIYVNSIFLSENTLLQAMTYQVASEYTPEHDALHAEFLAATRLME